jgi:hypothetical protein
LKIQYAKSFVDAGGDVHEWSLWELPHVWSVAFCSDRLGPLPSVLPLLGCLERQANQEKGKKMKEFVDSYNDTCNNIKNRKDKR